MFTRTDKKETFEKRMNGDVYELEITKVKDGGSKFLVFRNDIKIIEGEFTPMGGFDAGIAVGVKTLEDFGALTQVLDDLYIKIKTLMKVPIVVENSRAYDDNEPF